ncbi:hypothetical protein [Halalkalibacillus halophilus]|uniref:hypothetical protein n=1 Tax=Halalkalibacillus halophilus TaxID=392827 RepID=UPI0003FF1F3D|nr:hypothetical protein [Halalkalibacillus halophilus]
MSGWLYSLYFVLVGVIAVFTGEIVTFIMLAFIFIVLYNISTTLNKMYQLQKNSQEEK